MRYSKIMFAFCVILNLYQCRYTILRLTDICLQPVVWFLSDVHQYIQQQIDYSRDIKSCNQTNINYNYNYNLSQYVYECPQHRYSIRVIERRPLIVYIEQFLTANEIQHLIDLAYDDKLKHSMIMFDFVNVEKKRFKFSRNTRRHIPHHQYGWRKQQNICHWIIFIKIIYAIIFICFTISTYLNQSINDDIQCSKTIFIRIVNIWYSFLSLILVLSLFVDRLKRQNIIQLKVINGIQVLLSIAFISFVVLGHIQAYHYLWWPSLSSMELIRSTLLSIVFIDMCPISIVVIITIDSLKRRRLWRRVHASNIISSV